VHRLSGLAIYERTPQGRGQDRRINVLLASQRRARLADGWLQVAKASSVAARVIALTGKQRELTPAQLSRAQCGG
jgi:hypothetical protein